MSTQTVKVRSENGANNYNMIDLFKWIASILVVAIHTQVGQKELIDPATPSFMVVIIGIVMTLSKCAVPFFFMASTFFLGKKLSWEEDSEKNYLRMEQNARRTFRMYFTWSMIYLIPTIWTGISWGITGGEVAWLTILSLLLGGSYISIHLWFLLSMAITMVIMMFLTGKKIKNMKWMLPLSIVLYLVCFFQTKVPLTTEEPFVLKVTLTVFRWEIFTAPFYCLMGLYLARYEDTIRNKIPMIVKIILPIIFFVMTLMLKNQQGTGIPLHLTLAMLLLSINLKGKTETYLTFRKLSTYVYLIHMMVIFVWGKITGQETGLVPFIAVTVISNILAFGYHIFSQKRKGTATK